MTVTGVGDALKKSHATLRNGGEALVLMPALVPLRVRRGGRLVGTFDNPHFARRLDIAYRGMAAAIDAALFTVRLDRCFDVLEYFSEGQEMIVQERAKHARISRELERRLARARQIVLSKPSQLVVLRKLD